MCKDYYMHFYHGWKYHSKTYVINGKIYEQICFRIGLYQKNRETEKIGLYPKKMEKQIFFIS